MTTNSTQAHTDSTEKPEQIDPPSLAMVTIDCDDAHAMTVFWSKLLGGQITHDEGGYGMVIAGGVTLGFGETPDYRRPAWPDDGAKQFHLDLSAPDLTAAAQRAQDLGARLADPQPQDADGKWIVLLDPAGHPFCLASWS